MTAEEEGASDAYHSGDVTHVKTRWQTKTKFKREFCYCEKQYIITGSKVYIEMPDKDGAWRFMWLANEDVLVTLKGKI